MNKFGLLALLSVLGLFIITTWLKTISQPASSSKQENANQKSEYYLRKFNITEFNQLGIPSLHLSGDYLYYKPNVDITEILKPDIEYTSNNNFKWHIRADRIVSKSEALDELQLIGNVIAQRLADDQHEAADINADEMLFKPNAEYLESQGRTLLISHDNTIVATNGLTANLKTGLMTLSRVKGTYKANAN